MPPRETLKRGNTMNLPQIDASTLPQLAAMTGVFGSMVQKAAMAAGDSTVIVMSFLYDSTKK